VGELHSENKRIGRKIVLAYTRFELNLGMENKQPEEINAVSIKKKTLGGTN
jgi:hypothetical protein